MQRALDVGGRPQHTKQGWVAEFYLPEDECEGLVAEGCEFRIDRAYFDRLHEEHRKETSQTAIETGARGSAKERPVSLVLLR